MRKKKRQLTADEKIIEKRYKAEEASGRPSCRDCGVVSSHVVPVGVGAGRRWWSCLQCQNERMLQKSA